MNHNAAPQAPDRQSGAYYVSVVDGTRYSLALGPFIDDHAGALAMVDEVRNKATELDSRAWFYAYGTCRTPKDGDLRAGTLNDLFGMQWPSQRAPEVAR